MEDAVEQLDNLARSVSACTLCEELVGCRLRAVPGGGHPHCSVMVVSLSPQPADEQGQAPAGSALLDGLAEYMPALSTAGDDVYVTTLVKCVPRTGCELRAPQAPELDNCFPFLSRELTITTPHYLLTVGEQTTRYLLGRLFKDPPYTNGDSLELRLFDNPAFKIVPVATPDELGQRDARTRKEYSDRLRALAQVMGLQG
jgi:uracil-DNA glycosylase family 4